MLILKHFVCRDGWQDCVIIHIHCAFYTTCGFVIKLLFTWMEVLCILLRDGFSVKIIVPYSKVHRFQFQMMVDIIFLYQLLINDHD